MALHKFEITILPTSLNPSGRVEDAQASDVLVQNGWVVLADGSGVVVQYPEKFVEKVVRV